VEGYKYSLSSRSKETMWGCNFFWLQKCLLTSLSTIMVKIHVKHRVHCPLNGFDFWCAHGIYGQFWSQVGTKYLHMSADFTSAKLYRMLFPCFNFRSTREAQSYCQCGRPHLPGGHLNGLHLVLHKEPTPLKIRIPFFWRNPLLSRIWNNCTVICGKRLYEKLISGWPLKSA
jgi:hypothetical protein